MRCIVETGLALALASGVTAGAHDMQAPAVKGDPVIINGCVLDGAKPGSIILTHVNKGMAANIPDVWLGAEGTPAPEGGQQVIYWLSHDSVKKLRTHVGHRVEISGRISDISQGTVQVKKEPGKDGPDTKIEVDARGKEAKARTDKDVGTGPAALPGQKVEQTTSMPVHRIKVESVKVVAATCP